MRKSSAVGIVGSFTLGLAASIGLVGQAGAAERVINISPGSYQSEVEFSCTRINNYFTSFDCTYARTATSAAPDGLGSPPGSDTWTGPTRQGGYYPRGDANAGIDPNLPPPPNNTTSGNRISTTFNPNDSDLSTTNILDPDTGKVRPTLTGTVTIDDNNTPSDGTDDTVDLAFSIGQTARTIRTGESTQAVEEWDSMDHTMAAPYAVNAAVPNAGGGFDYIIGSRGTAPARLCQLGDELNEDDCYPTNNYNRNLIPFTSAPPRWWASPPIGGVGIERSDYQYTKGTPATPGPVVPTTPNVGIKTNATFQNYDCDYIGSAAQSCGLSTLIWGAAIEDDGFDNIVGTISTNAAGNISSAVLYWVEESFIGAFLPPSETRDNSWQGSTLVFSGTVAGTEPTANDDSFAVVANTANNNLNVLANDERFNGTITVTITVAPNQGGTATVNGDNTISYTPAAGFGAGGAATETFTYQAQGDGAPDTAVVTITVSPDIQPVGPDGSITISTQGVAPATITTGTLNVTTLGGYSAGNTPSAVSIFSQPVTGGTASVTGTTVRFTLAATFFAGSSSFVYRVTDGNGDTDNGTVSVTVTDVPPAIADGTITTEEDTVSPTTPLSITAGNGSVAQHTLQVTTNGNLGQCAINGLTVTYTPNPDAAGTDTCVITITDGDGDTDTGTISITVTEVADDLILPGGSSAVDPWSLLLLGSLPLLARRRRRAG